MRTPDHFKIPKEQRAEYVNYKPSGDELIKRPLVTPIYEVKNKNVLIDSAMLYFSEPVHRDHGFYPDPRIPYEAYVASETEKREKLRFGGNQTITFDINETVEQLVMTDCKYEPSSQKNVKTKSILKANLKTAIPYEPHSNPYIAACQEVLVKCYNMCGISIDYLDIDRMFDSLGKLMFGISNEFKMKELCFNYVLAAERRKCFEQKEGLEALVEQIKAERLELSELNVDLCTKLKQEPARVENSEELVFKLEKFEKVLRENTGLALVNTDLSSANDRLTRKLVDAEIKILRMDEVDRENSELKEKISTVTSKNRCLEEVHDGFSKQKQELESRNFGLLEINSELKSQKERLTECNEALLKNITDFGMETQEKNDKIKFLETQLESSKAKYDRDAKSDMRYFKNKINDMLKENVNQTSQLEKIKVSLEQAEQKIGKLLKDNESLCMDNNNVRADLQQKLKDIKDLQLQLKDDKVTFAKYAKLEVEKTSCDKALAHLRQEYAVLQECFQNLKETHGNLHGQNRELIQDRKAAHDALHELNEEVGKLEGINSNLQDEKRKDQSQMDGLNCRIENHIKTTGLLEKSNPKFREEPQELEGKIQALQRKYERLDQRYRDREIEIQQAKVNMRKMTISLYNARVNTPEHENVCLVTEDHGLVCNSSTAPVRKRDMLRSLANRRTVVITGSPHGINKNVY